VCRELGRFPFELPAGLPDEQLVLMQAYMELRAEIESGKVDQTDIDAGRAERELQAAESAAWLSRRGGA